MLQYRSKLHGFRVEKKSHILFFLKWISFFIRWQQYYIIICQSLLRKSFPISKSNINNLTIKKI